jgi:uncharacterized membrane protein YwzB
MVNIMVKFAVYILSAIISIFALDSVNLNVIFKKNKVVQARVFYLVLVFIFTYLLGSFLYDFIYLKLL